MILISCLRLASARVLITRGHVPSSLSGRHRSFCIYSPMAKVTNTLQHLLNGSEFYLTNRSNVSSKPDIGHGMPSGEQFFWVAKHSGTLELTLRGREYWRLLKGGNI